MKKLFFLLSTIFASTTQCPNSESYRRLPSTEGPTVMDDALHVPAYAQQLELTQEQNQDGITCKLEEKDTIKRITFKRQGQEDIAITIEHKGKKKHGTIQQGMLMLGVDATTLSTLMNPEQSKTTNADQTIENIVHTLPCNQNNCKKMLTLVSVYSRTMVNASNQDSIPYKLLNSMV